MLIMVNLEREEALVYWDGGTSIYVHDWYPEEGIHPAFIQADPKAVVHFRKGLQMYSALAVMRAWMRDEQSLYSRDSVEVS